MRISTHSETKWRENGISNIALLQLHEWLAYRDVTSHQAQRAQMKQLGALQTHSLQWKFDNSKGWIQHSQGAPGVIDICVVVQHCIQSVEGAFNR